MANLYETFETDTQAEQEGIDLQFGDAFFTVRRAGGANKAFTAELRRQTQPVRRLIQQNLLPDDASELLVQKAFFKTVLIDWRGVTDRSGADLPFNQQNFLKLMKDLPELWSAIYDAANQVSNFRKEQALEDGEILGN